MKLIYLPDSGLYLNPVHVLFVKKHYENADQYAVKFVNNPVNLIITKSDFHVLVESIATDF